MAETVIRLMEFDDIPGVVELQRAAFPPPFDEELLWRADHLHRHLEIFPEAQFVAVLDGKVVGSCSNTRISEEVWQAHADWDQTVGGPFLNNFDPSGSTLYGLDISVHPDARRTGIGRRFYHARYDWVTANRLFRYGTACRIPDYSAWRTLTGLGPEAFAEAVQLGEATDRTLTPLLRYGLTIQGVLRNYMVDEESGNAAVLLEWSNPL